MTSKHLTLSLLFLGSVFFGRFLKAEVVTPENSDGLLASVSYEAAGQTQTIVTAELNAATSVVTLGVGASKVEKNVDIDFKGNLEAAKIFYLSVVKGTVSLVRRDERFNWGFARDQNARYFFVKLRGCSVFVRLGDAVADDEIIHEPLEGYLDASNIVEAMMLRRECSAQ